MIQRRDGARFAAEAFGAIGFCFKPRTENLDRDFAAESRIAGAVDLAHSARADSRQDLVRSAFEWQQA